MLIDNLKDESKYSSTERRIAKLLLEKGTETQDQTIRELAKEIYSNPSSFIRFAHKLGYKGWNDLKKQYLKELDYLLHQKNIDVNIPFTERDSFAGIATKVTETKISAMNDTLRLLDNKKINQFINMLYKANEIVIFAHSVNLLLAQEFQFKMRRINRRVKISNLSGEQEYDILNMNEQDCSLFISYSGSGFEKELELLKKRHINIAAITGLTNNSMNKMANYIFNIPSRERLYSQIGNYSTNTSISLLLDIIYSEIFARDFRKNYSHIVQTGKVANVRTIAKL
ncbi:DNA-binding MurR/RpiR family transcriptional regulator [Lactobacillus colini]|uniref:DNA-binding MurR/RpiR family transcriptional regulator n=1 Tax=Lactobacillus colini TaxID=1819254 RepID=A0ABS4MGK5_9LACO|nr:MurR/RpiR family transcriptional regulator [Lactobacillus colini]MBP2058818.1 DNA-binding MurR/RpiR family transcriptional regulator [Lactobacillus colini]